MVGGRWRRKVVVVGGGRVRKDRRLPRKRGRKDTKEGYQGRQAIKEGRKEGRQAIKERREEGRKDVKDGRLSRKE
jgi:hypothetical protein